MGDSMHVNVGGLKDIARRFDSPQVKKEILKLPKAEPIAGFISQAVADNFAQEGPGWAPLKGKTLRLSVGKGQLNMAKRLAAYDMGAGTSAGGINKKKLKGRMAEFHEKTEKYLVRDERQARKTGAEAGRMILQKTGLLKKAATSPGKRVTVKGKSGANTYRVEGSTLYWGVDLVYATTQNSGNAKYNIPARPFLVVRDVWMKQIKEYMVEQIVKVIHRSLLRGE